METIDKKDILQIIAGSLTAAIVLAPNIEYHDIAATIPVYKLVFIFILTIVFIALLAYWIGGRTLNLHEIKTIAAVIPVRVVIIYGISLCTCFIALWIYDFINSETTPIVFLRELIVLCLPATWGGTLLDLIHSKNK